MERYAQFLAVLTCGHKRKVVSTEQDTYYCMDCDALKKATEVRYAFSYDQRNFKGRAS